MKIRLPSHVDAVLRKLNNSGYEAYVVGGCVRDALLGKEPYDWDITTNALPEQVRDVFAGHTIIATGIKHGTVTVIVSGTGIEITTYRTESQYTDHRHPDAVSFTRSLAEDLRRRDFTINALAYHPTEGLVDLYSGMADLAAGRIVGVGDPEKRFFEDALRIMRALRFSAQLGFTVEKVTDAALRRTAPLLCRISAERLGSELSKMLRGDHIKDVLNAYPDVLGTIMPELRPMVDLQQNNPYHHLSVYAHTVETVANVPPQLVLRLTMLLHDIGKPQCHTCDTQGIDHFHGHPAISAALAEQILQRLRLDKATIGEVKQLILHHDDSLSPTGRCARRLLARFGERDAMRLIAVQRADILGQHPDLRGRLDDLAALAAEVSRQVEQSACVSLAQLAVNGADLIAIGFQPGRALGDALQELLSAVVEDRCPNEKFSLLKLAAQLPKT